MGKQKMNTIEQIQKLNNISKKLELLAEDVLQLKQNVVIDAVEGRLSVTLDDIYRSFGRKKKHYAIRLKHAFLEHHVETIDDLIKLSLNDLLNMDGIGSETLSLLIKKLNGLGIDYYPVVTE
ncbi:MAG: hypothetical protein IJJ98_04265 [Prevotella sp.]|nr:hypothetical protein [Prevotella sp.]